MSAARHLVVGAALIALVTSCLSSLPDPIACPAAARFPAVTCPSPAPSPQGQCTLPVGCFQSQGRTCQCTEECSPIPTKDSCNAPPKCPAAIQPGAQCPPADVRAANPAPCACGCVSCASVCDGFGPIIGAGPTGAISINLPALPAQAQGRVGLLLRARGTADVHGAFSLDASAAPQSSARLESNEDFAEVLLAPEVPLGPGIPRTINVFSTAPIEVDCVVPYLVP